MAQVDVLDELKLSVYLEENVDGFSGPLKASKFDGGHSNPTFRIDAASGSYVLRRQPPGKLLKSAHAVDREYRVLAALAKTDVPVARVFHLCEDREVIGSMFYLMEFCDGNIHWQPTLSDIGSNEMRGQMYDEIVRVLASIHSVDLQAVGLVDYGRPGNYFQRQLERWTTQYRASELATIPEMEQLMAWLVENLPEDDGKVFLVHGDFRLDNLMFSDDNQRIIAVLDWELSTLGHPCTDLAYLAMGMRLPAPSGEQQTGGLGGLDRTALGIPGEEAMIARYCQLMGIDGIDNWNYYVAFSFFRVAAIVQGVAKRANQGNASNAAAGEAGAMIQPLARLAIQSLD